LEIEIAEIDGLLQRENPRIGSAPLILLNPNASDLLPLRRWPASRYLELARRLLERYQNHRPVARTAEDVIYRIR
jgi:ADP-heptose:LPS heptosyltransferase